jgi:hypothetical protein
MTTGHRAVRATKALLTMGASVFRYCSFAWFQSFYHFNAIVMFLPTVCALCSKNITVLFYNVYEVQKNIWSVLNS